MIIMFADIEYSGGDDYVRIKNNKTVGYYLSKRDKIQLFFIKMKMKFFANNIGKEKYIVHKKVSPFLREYLINKEKFKLRKYRTKKGWKYYHIYF